MSAIAPNIRQRLLCRSDLHAMEVDGEQIAQWLRSKQLLFLGHIDAEDLPGGDAVYATDDEQVLAELRAALQRNGRDGVVLATADAFRLLQGVTLEDQALPAPPVAMQAVNSGDMISEHVVQDGLDEAIDEITEAIDHLLVSTHNAPLDLRDDAPLHDAHETGEADDVVEVDSPEADAIADQDVLLEIEPEEVEAATAHALHDWATKPHAVRSSVDAPFAVPPDATATDDSHKVVETLQQILETLRGLTTRETTSVDFTPLQASICDSSRALEAAVAKATSRTTTDKRLDQIHETLLDVVDLVRSLGDSGAQRAAARSIRDKQRRSAAVQSRFSLASVRDNAGAILATASTLVGWSAAAWLYPHDGKFALGALVCANLVACAALLGRKPIAG